MARRAAARADGDRVRAAPALPPSSPAGAFARPAAGRGVERRGRKRQRGRGLRRLPAPQAGRAWPAAHGARRRLRPARLMPLRARLAFFGAGVVALALVVFGLLLYALLSRSVS